jgi:hypothetical protein
MFLKQSTAATIKLGPFVDSVDGSTANTALTISQADIRISKNGAAYAQTNNVAGATHDEAGEYGIPLDVTDTNTVGRLKVKVHEGGALPCWQEFFVLPANVFDSLLGTDILDVSVTQLAGVAQSLTDLKDFADDGYDPATNKVEGVKLADTVTTYTGNTPQTGDSFARLGVPAGASHAADNALAQADLDNIQTLIDTEVAAILAAVDTEVAAIKAKTDNLPASPAAVGSAMTLDQSQAITQRDVTGDTTPTVGDALLGAVVQASGAWSWVGTTLTLKNPDGSPFRTFTLDSETAPKART